MKKMIRIISCSVAFSLVSAFPISGSVNAATYRNCALFNVKYPKGIAISRSAASRQKIIPRVSASVYRAHKKLDKDKDGTVCEVKKVTVVTTVVSTPQTTLPSAATTSPPAATTGSVGAVSPSLSFSSELVPINGTVTGAYLGPLGSSSFPPERNFAGKSMCEVQAVKSVSFNHGRGLVTPCNQTDFVMLKYSGLIPKTNRGIQSIRIQTSHDDGVYLSIGGRTVLDKWRDCVCSSSLIIPNFDLNVDHSFELWYYEKSGEASLNLKWQSTTTTSNTRIEVPVSAAPNTTVSAAPNTTTTTTCSPNQPAINSLNERAGSWKIPQNKTRVAALLRYNGYDFGVWSAVFDSNNSVFTRALAALNSCKQIGYVFDDWNLILDKANKTRNLRLSDSVAYLVGA
jgi:hypothetical protein